MKRALILLLICAGCENVLPEVDFEQMIDQHKVKPYGASPWFSDGRGMQPPPLGTVPQSRIVGNPALAEGIVNGAYVTEVPVPVTRAQLEQGRARYEVYCAVCHGVDGSGESEVARNMELRKPPPLVRAPVIDFPPGRVYQVIAHGYGLMPSYATQLSVGERWAIVAYLGALQLSQHARLDQLPELERRAATTALGGTP